MAARTPLLEHQITTMPASKITDLLPIAEGNEEPHAYQVFGLEDGEQDLKKIAKTIQATIVRLKAAKSSTDSKLWKQAALLVQEARGVLADSEKKAQLDARFGIISVEPTDTASPSNSLTPADPLAAVLPTADPLAAVLPSTNPLEPAAGQPAQGTTPLGSPQGSDVSASPTGPLGAENKMPPGVFGAPAATASVQPAGVQPAGVQPAVSQSVGSAPAVVTPVPSEIVKVRRPKKRRGRPILGNLIFATFTLGLCGLVAGLVYFLFFGSGQLAISSNDGQITIRTKPNTGGPRVSQPRAGQSDAGQSGTGQSGTGQSGTGRRAFDPVMGNLRFDRPRSEPSGTASDAQPGSRTLSPPTMQPETGMGMSPDVSPGEGELPGSSEPPTALPASSPAADPAAGPSEPPMEQAFTDAMLEEADQALERVRGLIRNASWSEMKPAAEALGQMPMPEPQRAEAERLRQLADLATRYRTAIGQGVAKQNAGNEIVVNAVRLIVVETGADLLVLRLNAKTKSYTFNELPLSLVHQLVAFTLPDSPTTQAAGAVYQSVAPNATDAHRAEAIQQLEDISDDVVGADPSQLIEAIKELFSEEPSNG